MPDNRTTKQMITDVRKAPHSDDVALLCVRTEELIKMCIRLEMVLHEAAKEVEMLNLMYIGDSKKPTVGLILQGDKM